MLIANLSEICDWLLTISIIGILISGQLPYWLGGTEEIAHDASIYFAIIGLDRKSTRLNSSHIATSRMPSSA